MSQHLDKFKILEVATIFIKNLPIAKTSYGQFYVIGYDPNNYQSLISGKPKNGHVQVFYNDYTLAMIPKKDIINWEELPEFLNITLDFSSSSFIDERYQVQSQAIRHLKPPKNSF